MTKKAFLADAAVAVAMAVAVHACSSSEVGGSKPAQASDDGGGAESDASGSRSSACVAQDQSVQAALDAARTSPNAVIAVHDDTCGTSVYVSGDATSARATSLFRVGSVTKTYVSAVVLTLVRDGKVSLDDALAKWIPDVPNTTGVTVRMLLDHTSGIFNYLEAMPSGADPKRVWTPRELVDIATSHAPYFAPGQGWHYSNTNYILLGMIAEQAGGAKIGSLVRTRALAPAGLTHTFFDGEETVAGTMATGFSASKQDVTYAYDPSLAWTAGAIVASPADIADWITSLYASDAVLDASGRAALVANPARTGEGETYGLGVELLPASAASWVGAGASMGHGGDIAGFHTMAFWFPDKRTAVVAIVNQDGKSANDILIAALNGLFAKT